MTKTPKYPGERITANGNQLVSYHTEARITDAGVYYPITPSTEGGELYQQSFAEGNLNVFGRSTVAIEIVPKLVFDTPVTDAAVGDRPSPE